MSRAATTQLEADQSRERQDLQIGQEDADVETVMQTPAGRRFIWRQLAKAGVFRSIWDNSARIHYNEGFRNMGLWLMDEVMRVCPELYLTMQAEAIKKAKEDKLNDDLLSSMSK